MVERIAAAVRAKLTHIHAGDDDLVCPSCGYKGPESDFEPDSTDTDEGSDSDGERNDGADGYRTDLITTSTQNDDDVNERDVDQVPKLNDRTR